MPVAAKIDLAGYDKMLDAYRDAPGNFRACARATGFDRRTCKKAWLEGWPERSLRPLSDVLREEQAAARARLQQAREAEQAERLAQAEQSRHVDRARAADDAAQSRAEEATMVRASRHNALGLMASVQRLIKGANELTKKTQHQLETKAVEPAQALALIRAIASCTRQANEAARLAQQMERSLLGEPESWTGIAIDMTPAQAAHEIEMANRALARAKRRGHVVDTAGEVHEAPEVPVAAATDSARPVNGAGGAAADLQAATRARVDTTDTDTDQPGADG